MKSVILASTSPRRHQLLEQIGVACAIAAPSYEEDMTLALPVDELAWTLALGKAKSIIDQASKNDVIVAADTFIEFEGTLMGKPRSPDNAMDMLWRMRGKQNIVQTGYAVVDVASRDVVFGCVASCVKMRDYSDDEITRYISTGEPLDKAGAYAINGIGAILIDRVVDGDFSAIIGLPLGPVVAALRKFGINVL